MSLFSHCSTIDTYCVCVLINRIPDYATIALSVTSFFIQDISMFWLGWGLLFNYFVNVLFNLYLHPYDVYQVIFGTAGFLGNPSFQSQFCSYLVVSLVLFWHMFHMHTPAWCFVLLKASVMAVTFACVYLTNQKFSAVYLGWLIGFVNAVISLATFRYYLNNYSDMLCHSWFGDFCSLRHCYATREQLEEEDFHRRFQRAMLASGCKTPKHLVNLALSFHGLADNLESDPSFPLDVHEYLQGVGIWS